MKNILVIESPFQLISGIQYCIKNNLTLVDVIFIETGVFENNKQVYSLFDKILEVYDSMSLHLYAIKRGANKVSFLINLFLYLYRVKNGKYSKLIVGDVRSPYTRLFIHNIEYHLLTLVDDGIALINSVTQVDDLNVQFKVFKKWRLKLFDKYLYPLLINPKVLVFTILPYKVLKEASKSLTLDSYEENSFIPLHLNQFKNEKSDSAGKYYDLVIIGGAIVETGMVSESLYINKISSAVKKLKKKKDLKILYVKHRRESDTKVNTISTSLDCEIECFDLPLELVFLQGHVVSSNIITFTSAALYSLYKMSIPSKYYFIQLNTEELSLQSALSVSRMTNLFSDFAEGI